MGIKWDTSSFDRGVADLNVKIVSQTQKAVNRVADEVLRLSSFEVPHDTGLLQNSGHVEDMGDHAIVGYNKVYAARLHEHPEYRFQKGRKGKYLESPIKNNMPVLLQYYREVISGLF